ncbi:MAG: hypothetical protein I3274_07480 [Candidatus Moeniiplasma glomeromycotorum]|nr:hypothetical protein [Candidatus Moeniiplasma glomeromycotorum]MCE8168310.1 hypothetical protein [Candidatus Moeniiplasma glomeromycotorum]
MNKITSTEFETYHKKFRSFFLRMTEMPEFQKQSKEEQEKSYKFLGLLLNEIDSGNVVVLYSACEFVENILKEEDLSPIKNRAKEHIIARGYYNPLHPLNLTEYRERIAKIKGGKLMKLWENHQEYFYQLLLEMNQEDHDFIWRFVSFCDSEKKTWEEKEEENKWTEEKWQKVGFIWEDVLKTLEAAQVKLEAKKKKTAPLLPKTLRWVITNSRELSTN